MLLHTMRRWLAANTTLPASAPGLPLPRGKGMFVGTMGPKVRGVGTPEQVAARARQAGLTWVAPCVMFQRREGDQVHNRSWSLLDQYVAALRQAGVREIWPWAYPIPERFEVAVDRCREAAVRYDSPGILIDPEYEYIGRPRDARRLMDRALEVHGEGRSLGVSSYGAPWNFKGLPWRELARADFGIPQCYDSHGKLGDDYPAKAVAAYRAAGFRCVIPAFPTYGARSDDLEHYLRCFPPSPGYIGWQWRLTDDLEWGLLEQWLPAALEASA